MKKIIASILALCIALSMSITAFASQAPTIDEVNAQIDASVTYMVNNGFTPTLDNAVNYYYLTEVSSAADGLYNNFAASVADNMAQNNNHIVPQYGENATTTGAAAIIALLLDEDGTLDAEALGEQLAQLPPSTVSNPYYYDVVCDASSTFCDDAVTKAFVDQFIADYYPTMGAGMNYWGDACDNDAMFISALAQSGLADDYRDYIDDAMAHMDDNYKVDGGYCYNPMYGTEPNSDSTGLALRAKCAYFLFVEEPTQADLDELADIYNDLMAFKGSTEGSFTYAGTESTLSTMDAIKGMNLYQVVLLLNQEDEEETTTEPTTKPQTTNKAEETTKAPEAKPNTSKTSPATGATTLAIAVAAIGAGAITLAAKKKED